MQDTAAIFVFLLTVILLIVYFFHHRYQYWARKGVPTIPPKFPFGNSAATLPKSFTIGLLNKAFYDYLKARGHRFGGVFLVTEPNLVVLDPDIIKDVLCKEFRCFVDRGFYHNKKADPVSANLFAVDGSDWRKMRVKLTPTFTSMQMKTMFQTIVACSGPMLDYISNHIDEDLDMKEIAGKYTTDVIGSVAFGIECNSFKNPDAEFRKMGKKIFHFDFWRAMRALIIVNLPNLAKIMGVPANNKDVREFFIDLVENTIKMRKERNLQRKDFLQILMDLEDTLNLTTEEIAAQVFLFFVAGFESSSVTITFALYELGLNQEIQNKLRENICQVLANHDDQFTYDALKEMTYLKQVLDETLRKWPPGLTLNRRCTEEYTIPGTKITVPKGTPILISCFGLHRDPDYYPDPDKFDPDRFTEENSKNRHPFVYLPFGEGSRSCIGKRHGLNQTKLAVARIVKDFKIFISPSTKEIEIDPGRFVLSSVNPIYFKLEKL